MQYGTNMKDVLIFSLVRACSFLHCYFIKLVIQCQLFFRDDEKISTKAKVFYFYFFICILQMEAVASLCHCQKYLQWITGFFLSIRLLSLVLIFAIHLHR